VFFLMARSGRCGRTQQSSAGAQGCGVNDACAGRWACERRRHLANICGLLYSRCGIFIPLRPRMQSRTSFHVIPFSTVVFITALLHRAFSLSSSRYRHLNGTRRILPAKTCICAYAAAALLLLRWTVFGASVASVAPVKGVAGSLLCSGRGRFQCFPSCTSSHFPTTPHMRC